MGKTDEKHISVANETLTNGNIEECQELKMKEIVKKKPYIPPYCEVIKIEMSIVYLRQEWIPTQDDALLDIDYHSFWDSTVKHTT